MERGDVEPCPDSRNLLVAHAGAHIAPVETESRKPAVLVQHLRAAGEQEVDGHVLAARQVPQQPHDGVHAPMRAETELAVGPPVQQLIFGHTLAGSAH